MDSLGSVQKKQKKQKKQKNTGVLLSEDRKTEKRKVFLRSRAKGVHNWITENTESQDFSNPQTRFVVNLTGGALLLLLLLLLLLSLVPLILPAAVALINIAALLSASASHT